MTKRASGPQKTKRYKPPKKVKGFVEEKLRLLESGNTSRRWDKKKVDFLEKMFQSYADLIYFLENTAVNTELHEVFKSDLQDFFDIRPPRQTKQLHTLFGIDLTPARLQETAFTRLIFASIAPAEDPGDEAFQTYRLKLLDTLQSIIFAKMSFVLRHTFGTYNQVTKSALRDIENSCGWTGMVGKADYEKDYKPKRILDFPSPYSTGKKRS